MKIILSRKGFDSANGGYPSPILPDGRLISLPIPQNDERKYSELEFDGSTLRNKGLKSEINNYYDLMNELEITEIRVPKKDKHQPLTKETTCHLDPDIYRGIVDRCENWRPLFGQRKSAQGHLDKQDIKGDDIFLFFGWFKETEIARGGKLRFKKNAPDLHIIFGYFQIGTIIKSREELEEWMEYHPHCNYKEGWAKNNTLYVARKKLSWNPSLPGANMFNRGIILTADRQPKKSIWRIPVLKGKKISFHNESSWIGDLFKSAPIGQEFVVNANKEIENWAKKLIEENVIL